MKISDMASPNVKYVITEDSAQSKTPSWGSNIFKYIFFILSLITVTIVILYFCGIIDGISALEIVEEDGVPIVGMHNNVCLSYSRVVDSCFDITHSEIAINGCNSYVETSGGVCVSYNDGGNLCIVNPDCDFVDAVELNTLWMNEETEAFCEKYSTPVGFCSDVTYNDIVKNGCSEYVESSGGVCVLDDDRASCVVNSNCDLVDIKGLLTMELENVKSTLCENFSFVVDSCSEVSGDDIAENDCSAFIEKSGGICTFRHDSRTSCVVNSDCDSVDPSFILTEDLRRVRVEP